MILNSFFSPLNISILTQTIIILICFEIIGASIGKILNFPKFLRISLWMLGLGVFVFLWFCLHFFIKFDFIIVYYSLFFITTLFAYFYYKNKLMYDLVKSSLFVPFLVVFLYPLAKPLFVLLSLPPYSWDEMAYHFISPNQLLNETQWIFTTPLYPDKLHLYKMIPRFLDTAYTLMFSMTHTYASARVLHLSIFLSSILVVASFIKDRINLFSGIVFCFLGLYLTPEILESSTMGYVDSGTAGFLILTFVSAAHFIDNQKISNWIPIVIFSAFSVASKYTSLGFVGAIYIVLFIYLIVKFYKLKINIINYLIKNKKDILKFGLISLISFIIFGGYWYLKNFFLSGNPIYPFIFPCWFDYECGSGQSFFSGWSVAINRENFFLIRDELFQKNLIFYKLALLSILSTLFISITSNSKKILKTVIFMFLVILVEVLLVKNISGFIPRYFFHWYLLIAFIVSTPWQINWKAGKKLFSINILIIISLFILSLNSILLLTKKNKSIYFDINRMTPTKYAYALGKISLEEWTISIFPKMNEVIKFCGESKENKKIIVADPELIWNSYEGLIRSYLISCSIEYASIEDTSFLKKDNLKAVSLTSCLKKEVTYKNELMNDYFKLNQNIVCNWKKNNNVFFNSKK
jgi:hypothetical protein